MADLTVGLLCMGEVPSLVGLAEQALEATCSALVTEPLVTSCLGFSHTYQ